ncbi:hemolysin-III-like protein [Encephalitozoon intestinalis ATCC 50506]|uniref:Hemolysin-III-like protein n=1 Tax=Encephalitozoon intestinalis (strain ATCC 50506) TaxID=876142 RepID=E0S7S3_ENCIT|nr:hemolysin-III-like protein [Encephalitozoon intestinalis ATCC 50506]ADM11752.1 hemolysin-III-like protein [Encephalitozoon intestinalis ATCC 50506]UTX45493.1 adiponectin receptor [Encephalitozoon intestinalis]
MTKPKPMLRGRIHQIAFYLTIVKTFLYTICCFHKKGNFGIMIYLLSQLILFGVSSTYHVTSWKDEKIRSLFQRLDHISIFLLISGTQTSVILTLVPVGTYTKYALLMTWTISLAGILKIVLMKKLHLHFDLMVYILHGISVIPFFRIIASSITVGDTSLFILGGAIYIIGGLIYGIEKPNPYPQVFGYHEIFHVMTVLANWCFLIPLLKGYISTLSGK